MRKTIFSIVLSLALFALFGCSDAGGSSGTEIAMVEGQVFDPHELTVSAGDTVTWANESSEAHTVTAYDDLRPRGGVYFASGGAGSEDGARDELEDGLLDEGETFEVTFEQPGTYTYFCVPHEAQGMVGTIVVEEGE